MRGAPRLDTRWSITSRGEFPDARSFLAALELVGADRVLAVGETFAINDREHREVMVFALARKEIEIEKAERLGSL